MIQQEAREVTDDEYRGLKQTSNTNKTRMEILGLIDEAYSAGKDAANSEWRMAIVHLQTKERESVLKTLESWRNNLLQEVRNAE